MDCAAIRSLEKYAVLGSFALRITLFATSYMSVYRFSKTRMSERPNRSGVENKSLIFPLH